MIKESPIVIETRTVRSAISKNFDDDIERYVNYLMDQQQGHYEKTDSLKEAQHEYSRTYLKWDSVEDQQLREKFAEGASLMEIADMLQRKPGAIQSRLKKMHLK